MTHYIAELDQQHRIAAVWVKDDTTRAPRVFDPVKHEFDAEAATGFFGAPRAAIEAWLRGPQGEAQIIE